MFGACCRTIRRNPVTAPFWAPRGDGWGQFPHSYFIPSAGFATTYIHTFLRA